MEQKVKQVPVCSENVMAASGQLGLCGVGGGIPRALEIIAENPRQQGFRPTKVIAAQLVELSVQG